MDERRAGRTARLGTGSGPYRTGAVLAALVVAACGSGGSAPSDDPSANGATPAAAAALPAGEGIGFAARAVGLPEAARRLAVDVVRTGDGAGAARVAWRTRSVDATPDEDYRAALGELAWRDGETGARRIELVVHSDADVEGPESFEIVLEPLAGTRPETRALAVTIEDSPCGAALATPITTDTLVDAACTRLDGEVRVTGSATLRLAPGATLVASAGARLLVQDSATLALAGTAARPVALAGAVRAPGHWQGVRLESSSALHVVDHAALGDAATGLDFAGEGPVRVTRSSFARTTDAALSLPLDAAAALDASNSFAASPGGVRLTGAAVRTGEPVTLPAIGTHYTVAEKLIVADALTLEPGVEARFEEDGLVWVSDTGSIDARGTADAPIVLRGAARVPGHWRGLRLVGSASAGNRLEHVRIGDAGRQAGFDGNLVLGGRQTRLQARHLTLHDGAGVGLWMDAGLSGVSIEAPSFAGNALGEVREGGALRSFAPPSP